VKELKGAYSQIDTLIQEVAEAEQASLENICAKLQEENKKANSPLIEKIVGVLKDWGKVPANEIKERSLRL